MNLKRNIEFNFFLLILFLMLFLFALMFPSKIREFPSYVNWDTIISLTSLLMITSAVKESYYFDYLALKLLKRFDTERTLALLLLSLALTLSTFLTNDISLFIIIPITLSIQSFIKRDLVKLLVFETLAVNIGSSLTPIGNPQNLYLWYQWKISFFGFIVKLFPLVFLLTLALLILSFFSFSNQSLMIECRSKDVKSYDKSLLWISLSLFTLFILSLELDLEPYFLLLCLAVFLVFNRKILFKIDWALLLMFVLIFIDFHLLSTLKPVVSIVKHFDLSSSQDVFLLSVLSSQVISNVPASVFVSKFSHDWLAIAYGVNIGGNGILISSLANLITLRLANKKGLIKKFHLFSIPFCVVFTLLFYLVFAKLVP